MQKLIKKLFSAFLQFKEVVLALSAFFLVIANAWLGIKLFPFVKDLALLDIRVTAVEKSNEFQDKTDASLLERVIIIQQDTAYIKGRMENR